MKSHRKTAPLVARLAGLSCVAAALFGMGGIAQGQAPDGVRVIDLKYIFEHHNQYKAGIAALRTEFEASAKRVQDERNAIIALEGRLKDLVNGSPDYKRLDEEIAAKKADWKLKSDKQLKVFREREAEMLRNVYYQVTAALDDYCKKNNIGLVLQFNGDPPDDRTPQGIMRMVTRLPVYVSRDRDITPVILDAINSGRGVRLGDNTPAPGPSVPIPNQRR